MDPLRLIQRRAVRAGDRSNPSVTNCPRQFIKASFQAIQTLVCPPEWELSHEKPASQSYPRWPRSCNPQGLMNPHKVVIRTPSVLIFGNKSPCHGVRVYERSRVGKRGIAVRYGNCYLGCEMDTARSVGMALDRAIPAVNNEEAALVKELQAGSEEAFAYLLAVYQNPVFNLIGHIVENPADVADVLQDVFVKVFKGIRQFHGESSLKTWMYKIAVHEASNHRRSWLRRHFREPVSMDDETASAVRVAECQAGPPNPYQLLAGTERQEIVSRALASLAQPYRTVVVLREVEGLSYEEIAHVTGVAEGTVKSRLLRGRELLRRKLECSLGENHV